VLGEKNCRGWGEVDGTRERIPHKWQEAKTRKGVEERLLEVEDF
jgi:hypothetical protein